MRRLHTDSLREHRICPGRRCVCRRRGDLTQVAFASAAERASRVPWKRVLWSLVRYNSAFVPSEAKLLANKLQFVCRSCP